MQFPEGSHPSVEGTWNISDFENYLRGTHESIMTTKVCGFDQYLDNHYGYDGPNPFETTNLTHVEALFTTNKMPFHWMKDDHDNMAIYGVDPTGWGV